MKNLGWNKFANVAPNNPTQTMLTRTMRTPGGVLPSDFARVQSKWDKIWKDGLTTDWDVYFGVEL